MDNTLNREIAPRAGWPLAFLKGKDFKIARTAWLLFSHPKSAPFYWLFREAQPPFGWGRGNLHRHHKLPPRGGQWLLFMLSTTICHTNVAPASHLLLLLKVQCQCCTRANDGIPPQSDDNDEMTDGEDAAKHCKVPIPPPLLFCVAHGNEVEVLKG